jgi:ABC-type multidrug transport system ATPase subunit
VIALEAASRTFGRGPDPVRALRDISLDIRRGEAVGVVGPNGAGKSTLFALLLGFLRPTAGRIAIDGRAPKDWVRRHGAGYLPDRFRLPRGWPVADALAAWARLDRVAAPRAAAAAAIERLGLAPVADRPAGSLSRGELQRLGLAQALLAPRPLVVLDEPTAGLDPEWRVRFRGLIGELRAGGTTLLMASHEPGEVERLVDRVVVLRAGRVAGLLEARPAGGPLRRRLRLATPHPSVAGLFPGARPAGGDEGRDWLIEVGDAAELSARLAALLADGALIEAVEPAGPGLETRVREGLGPPDA